MVQEYVYSESFNNSLTGDLIRCVARRYSSSTRMISSRRRFCTQISGISSLYVFCNLCLARCSTTPQDYDGPNADPGAGRDYFKKRFARLAQKANQKEREVYIQCVIPEYMHRLLFLLC